MNCRFQINPLSRCPAHENAGAAFLRAPRQKAHDDDGYPTSNVTGTVKPSPTGPVALSPAAERMRRYRERQRQGLRCLTIQLRETEIDALIRKGLLNATMRTDPIAVSKALYTFLEHTLG